MSYQTIILDMDGTLLNEFNIVSDRLRKYLIELRKSGKLIFIATGRTLKEVRDVIPHDLEVDGLVTANGMSVFIGQEQFVEHALPPLLVKELIEKARNREIYYEVHPNEGTSFTLVADKTYMCQHTLDPKPDTVEANEWFSRKIAVKEQIVWKEQLNVQNISKIYFFSKDMKRIQEWKTKLDSLKKQVSFTSFSSTDHNVEVMVANVSKATGIQYLLNKFALCRDQIIAVGDGENDLPMFKVASHSVAMKNASDFVKKQADEVTDYPYNEDGLYHFLKKTFKQIEIED
jgi:Cof subfamily protein (haloacid dehalogenase superfamily)